MYNQFKQHKKRDAYKDHITWLSKLAFNKNQTLSKRNMAEEARAILPSVALQHGYIK